MGNQGITMNQLTQNLSGWLAAEAPLIEQARGLGAGGWEKWCIVQFLTWQINTQPQGTDLDYWRELPLRSGQIQRFFDIAYNQNAWNPQGGFPLILSQWKAGNTGNTVSEGVFEDIGTLVEFTSLQGAVPFIVALSPEPVSFPGAAASGPVNGTSVQIYVSTQQTWDFMSGLRV